MPESSKNAPFVLVINDGDEIAMGHYAEAVEWFCRSVKTGVIK
jgi:hypothetical protein